MRSICSLASLIGESESCSVSVWLFATPRTIQSMEFSRPEYWSGCPFPFPGDLNSGIKPRSTTWQVDSLPTLFNISNSSGCMVLSYYSLKFFFNFNWRIIALQYCVGFCCTTMWISCVCVCVCVCECVSCSVQFSHSVVSDSLWPHESQHSRPPCPSPTPRVHSNSCPSSRWCHPDISSSVVPLSSCPQSSQGLFQWVNSLHEMAKVLQFQLQHQSFQWTPRTNLL